MGGKTRLNRDVLAWLAAVIVGGRYFGQGVSECSVGCDSAGRTVAER